MSFDGSSIILPTLKCSKFFNLSITSQRHCLFFQTSASSDHIGCIYIWVISKCILLFYFQGVGVFFVCRSEGWIYILGEVMGMKTEIYFTKKQIMRAFRTLNSMRFTIK